MGTTHYNLTQPLSTDRFNLQVWNDNMEQIDQRMYLNQTTTFNGATELVPGSVGNVPAPQTSEKDKFLKGDGTWDDPSGASAVSDLTDVDLTNLSNGQILKFNGTTQKWENANESGGGGGASAVSDLTDVDLTNLSNGQILKYDATSQKWINADEGGGSTEVRRYLGQLCPRVTGTDSHISQSSNGIYGGSTEWYSWGAFTSNTITTWGLPDVGAAWVDNHDNSPWISYHFDEPRYFTELTIDCGSNYGGSFTGSIYIEASNDGAAWVDIGGGVKTINAPYQSIGTNTYTLDDTDTWEYIRIRGAQSFWILNQPSCFMQSINVYGGDIVSGSKSDIVVVSRTDNTNQYAWLKPCDANGNVLRPSEVTILSIFGKSDMSGVPPYNNGLNLCVNTDSDEYNCKLYNSQTGGYVQDGVYSVEYVVAYIPNSGGSGGGGSSETIYSTTEHRVGTWIDGSDVYEKTIVLRENGTDNFSYVDYVFAQALPSGIDWIDITTLYAKRNSGGYVDCMNNQNEIILVPNPTTQGIYFYSAHAHTDVTITIRYTKTGGNS